MRIRHCGGLLFGSFFGRRLPVRLVALTLVASLGLLAGCGNHITPANANITLTSNNVAVAQGGNVTFSATVSSANSTALTGSVNFTSDGAAIGQAAALVQGVGSLNVDNLAVGIHSVTAIYNGDAQNLTSTSHHYLQEISGDTTVSIVATSATGIAHTVVVPVHFR